MTDTTPYERHEGRGSDAAARIRALLGNTPSERAARIFAVLVCSGMATIFATKWLGYGTVVTTGLPVVVMVGYALLLKFRNLRVSDEQAADNFYYMGFLFTLTSLGMALYQFGQGEGVEQIIRNFGIALATTITGIALRILWLQTRLDPVEIEHQTRLELADASRSLTAEMSNSAREFTQFRADSLQMVEEGFERVRVLAEEASERTRESLAGIVEAGREPLDEASRAFAERTDAIAEVLKERITTQDNLFARGHEALTEMYDGMAQDVKEVRKHLKSLERMLSKVQTPEEIVRIEMDDVISGLRAAIDDAGEQSRVLKEKWADGSDALTSAAASVDEIARRLSDPPEPRDTSNELMAEVRRTAEAVVERLDRLSDAFERGSTSRAVVRPRPEGLVYRGQKVPS